MAIRRLPRRNRGWRLLIAAALLLVAIRWGCRDPTPPAVDPATETIPAGSYRLRRVSEAGLLDLAVASPDGPSRALNVRLLGIQLVDAQRAVRHLRKSTGDLVRLRFDRRRLDQDGTLLAYAFVGDRLLNAELVRRGWAREATHPADAGSMIRQLQQAEAEARQSRVGCWRDP